MRSIRCGTRTALVGTAISALPVLAVTVPVVDNVYEFPLEKIHEDIWNTPKLVHGATASGG